MGRAVGTAVGVAVGACVGACVQSPQRWGQFLASIAFERLLKHTRITVKHTKNLQLRAKSSSNTLNISTVVCTKMQGIGSISPKISLALGIKRNLDSRLGEVERKHALGWRDDRAGHAHHARVGAVRAYWQAHQCHACRDTVK